MSRGVRVRLFAVIAAVTLIGTIFATAGVSSAAPNPPWDGTYVSAGLGPTYGEAWCANPAGGGTSASANVTAIGSHAFQATCGGFITFVTATDGGAVVGR